jgi:hypothetical protein
LLLVYPMLRSSELVGTDLVQRSHWSPPPPLDTLLFGDFQLDLKRRCRSAAVVGCTGRSAELEACVCARGFHTCR